MVEVSSTPSISVRGTIQSYFRIREFQGVLEDLDFLTNLILIFRIVNTGLHQIIEVDLSKLLVIIVLRHLNAKETQDALGKQIGKARDGPQQDIADPRGNGEKGEHRVRIVLKEHLRQEFARKEHHHRRQKRIGSHSHTVAEIIEERLVEDLGKEDTIDHEGDVVAHEHRRDEMTWMLVEYRQTALRKSAFLTVHLCQHTVAGDKSYFHP